MAGAQTSLRSLSKLLHGPVSARALPFLRSIGRIATDVVFPPACLNCRQSTDRAGGLCAACWAQMRFIERPFCDRLGTPFAADFGHDGLISPEAVADPPVYGRARAVALFEDGPARQLVHRLKYGDRMELAKPLGAWMARAGQELLTEADSLCRFPCIAVVLPPAASIRRMPWRRRSPVESGVPVDPFVLARVKPTPSQVGLSRSQRALNMQGAFRVSEAHTARVEGRRIVLIDDVMTSGATVNAASRALLRSGAKHVDVLVFARAV